MGKKAATARTSGAASGGKSSIKEAGKMDPYGWEQYSEEGPVFWVRQLAGLFIVILGTLILATSYTEDHWYLPVNSEYGSFISLATIAVGALVHEFRPWKRLEMIRGICEESQKEEEKAGAGKKKQ